MQFKIDSAKTPFELVYFIKCGPHVKVGTCRSDMIRRRIHTLQVANPVRLEPLGYILGGHETEMDYHKILERYRVSGEWFCYAPFLASHINSVSSDFSTIPKY